MQNRQIEPEVWHMFAEARQDLRDIYEYIAYELLVSETAAGQTEQAMIEVQAEILAGVRR